jgi:hypothetical protein
MKGIALKEIASGKKNFASDRAAFAILGIPSKLTDKRRQENVGTRGYYSARGENTALTLSKHSGN